MTYTGAILNASYEDGAAAIEWLVRVFGFREKARYVDANDRVMQAELYMGDQPFWLDGHEPGYWAARGGAPKGYLLVLVDDVDAHHAHLTAAGVDAPTPTSQDYGMRTYVVSDPEGWQWCFMQELGTPYVQRIPTEEGGWREILPGA